MEPAAVDDLQEARRRADQVHSRLVEIGGPVHPVVAAQLAEARAGVSRPLTDLLAALEDYLQASGRVAG